MYEASWMVVKDDKFVDFTSLSDAIDFRDKLDKQGMTGVRVVRNHIPTIPAQRTPVTEWDNCRRCGQKHIIRDLLCFTCTQQVNKGQAGAITVETAVVWALLVIPVILLILAGFHPIGA